MLTYSKLYEIPVTIFSKDDADKSIYDTMYIPSKLTNINNNKRVIRYLKNHCHNLKRGDVIHFKIFGNYRNHGKLMWDGVKMIHLAYNVDDYGHVPAKITIDEFPHKKYFKYTIGHNSLVNINGRDYYIIMQGTKHYGSNTYNLFEIQHVETKKNWYIVTPLSGKEFRSELNRGIFETSLDSTENESDDMPDNMLYSLEIY